MIALIQQAQKIIPASKKIQITADLDTGDLLIIVHCADWGFSLKDTLSQEPPLQVEQRLIERIREVVMGLPFIKQADAREILEGK